MAAMRSSWSGLRRHRAIVRTLETTSPPPSRGRGGNSQRMRCTVAAGRGMGANTSVPLARHRQFAPSPPQPLKGRGRRFMRLSCPADQATMKILESWSLRHCYACRHDAMAAHIPRSPHSPEVPRPLVKDLPDDLVLDGVLRQAGIGVYAHLVQNAGTVGADGVRAARQSFGDF